MEDPSNDTQQPVTDPVQATEPEVHPAVGVADGAAENGERIVYERNEAGEVIAWHKEPLTLADKAAMGDKERQDG